VINYLKRIALLLTGFLLTSTLASAKIWQVNNTGVGIADFTTLQAAHNGAAAGDTLYIYPSASHYGALTSVKKLIIFGVGFFLRENYADYPTSFTSSAASITLNNGSQGSLIAGLYSSFSGSQITINTSDITIQRNYNWDIFLNSTGLSNITILQNYDIGIQAQGSCANVIIKNNLLYPYGHHVNTCQCLIINNVFRYNSFDPTYDNQIFLNNIRVGGALNIINSSLSNNIDAGGTTSFIFGTSNGNKGGYTSEQILLAQPAPPPMDNGN
jgi:hypothetical protein